ncbi:hypothetical protein [Spirillospora albida]|uniref:hypothetical protein n=1 Tax=Spirillospora albida TaxID=58123 RepID=UPI0006923661|nr:hypothetical protein [Spirillospora albida]
MVLDEVPWLAEQDEILTLGPLNVAEVGRALGLGPADAIDAHLVSGGLPGILRTWPHGMPVFVPGRR